MTKPVIHYLDARGKILGRLATEIASLLRGKSKLGFTYHQDHGDRVVVANADQIRLTGRKAEHKKYYRHSGYPGNLKEISFLRLQQTHPDRIIVIAVSNMLPNNRLRSTWLKRLTFNTSGHD